jgi:hypothetical protein
LMIIARYSRVGSASRKLVALVDKYVTNIYVLKHHTLRNLQNDALRSALLLGLQSCARSYFKHFSNAFFGFSTAFKICKCVDLFSHSFSCKYNKPGKDKFL